MASAARSASRPRSPRPVRAAPTASSSTATSSIQSPTPCSTRSRRLARLAELAVPSEPGREGPRRPAVRAESSRTSPIAPRLSRCRRHRRRGRPASPGTTRTARGPGARGGLGLERLRTVPGRRPAQAHHMAPERGQHRPSRAAPCRGTGRRRATRRWIHEHAEFDHVHVGAGQRPEALGQQPVEHQHVGLGQRGGAAHGQQVRVTRPAPTKLRPGLVRRPRALGISGPCSAPSPSGVCAASAAAWSAADCRSALAGQHGLERALDLLQRGQGAATAAVAVIVRTALTVQLHRCPHSRGAVRGVRRRMGRLSGSQRVTRLCRHQRPRRPAPAARAASSAPSRAACPAGPLSRPRTLRGVPSACAEATRSRSRSTSWSFSWCSCTSTAVPAEHAGLRGPGRARLGLRQPVGRCWCTSSRAAPRPARGTRPRSAPSRGGRGVPCG